MESSEIEKVIKKNLNSAEVYFTHSQGCNLSIKVISPDFEGLSLVSRHKLVLGLFADSFASGSLHAMSLSLKTPLEG
ncbi:MAG: BolA/IbaG family iron-sulfur metabolism protein [Gammaproteobacteria bacterium]